MKAPPVSLTAGGLLVLVALPVVAYLVWKAAGAAREAAGAVGAAAADAAQAVNPLNPDNVFAETVNKVGGAIAGQPEGSWSLGGWIYDVTHPSDYDPTKPASTGGATGSW